MHNKFLYMNKKMLFYVIYLDILTKTNLYEYRI